MSFARNWQLAPERPISALGFGCASIGNLYQAIDDNTALEAVKTALAKGINFFDTAPYYGFGLSEKRLGLALNNQQKPFISTKVGRLLEPAEPGANVREGFCSPEPFKPVFDYSYDGIMRSVESSLQRLGVEHIDLLLAHDLGEVTHKGQHSIIFRSFVDSGYKAMNELKEAGVVGAIGIGAKECEVFAAAAEALPFDCFMIAGRYTLLDCSANELLFPICEEKNIKVILAGPYNSGILATGANTRATKHYEYSTAPAHIVQRVQKIEDLCAQFNVALQAAALQFPIAHPLVSCVLAGFANAKEVEQAKMFSAQSIPCEFWHALKERRLIAPELPVPEASNKN